MSGHDGDDHDDFDDDDDDAWAAEMIADGWAPMDHPPLNEEVEAHIERCFGYAPDVLHEHLSKHVHLDIDVIGPSEGRNFTVYVTSGMSDLPMTTPDDSQGFARTELLVALTGPPEAHRSPDGGDHYLVRALRDLARYPHATGAWLFYRHTVGSPDGDPIGPDTAMTGFLLGMPTLTPIVADALDAFTLTLSDGDTVHFASLVPLHPDELAFKLEHGVSALMDLLDDAGVTELYDPARPSVIRPRRRFDWKSLLGRPM
jgi:hypothetical protein